MLPLVLVAPSRTKRSEPKPPDSSCAVVNLTVVTCHAVAFDENSSAVIQPRPLQYSTRFIDGPVAERRVAKLSVRSEKPLAAKSVLPKSRRNEVALASVPMAASASPASSPLVAPRVVPCRTLADEPRPPKSSVPAPLFAA